MGLFPFSLSVLFFLLLSAASFSTSFADVFPGCNNTFACGSIPGVSYPFTGGNRAVYCGPPEFHLRCVDDSPELTIDFVSYRVLHLDETRGSLILARLDLWNNSCTNDFFNSTSDSSVFSFDSGNEDLTLFYGCSSINYTPENHFICNYSGIPTDSYYLMGAIPTDPILSITECEYRIRVPILLSSSQWLADNRSLLGEALMKGFNVNYSVPFGDQCSDCLNSGGSVDSTRNSVYPCVYAAIFHVPSQVIA